VLYCIKGVQLIALPHSHKFIVNQNPNTISTAIITHEVQGGELKNPKSIRFSNVFVEQ